MLLNTTRLVSSAMCLLIWGISSPVAQGNLFHHITQATTDTWVDRSPHKVRFARVNGIRLHYLDWGGRGDTLLFLHGMGDTAHIFDDLAPKFTDRFRILGLTRRGHGKSDVPATGYDTGTLVEDIRQFLDELKIRQVTLVGHSLAGNELTRFAEVYPDRIRKLIYLDAAYDRAGLQEKMADAPARPFPSKEIRSSFASVRQWVISTTPRPWTEAWEADFREVILFDLKEKVWRGKMSASVNAALLKGSAESRPDYTKVKAPALSFYALYDVVALCEIYPDEDSRQKMKEILEQVLIPHQKENIARFKREMAQGQVIEMPDTDHACFIQKQGEVVREMRAFLLGKSVK